MISLSIDMADANIRETLARIGERLTPSACATVVAEAGADVVRDHLVTLSRTRHRPNQKINYYLQAADSVIRETSGGDAVIRIPHTGMAQRYHGGDIVPSGRPSPVTGKPVTRLAVPLSGTPAEGHVPADFPSLFLVTRKGVKRGDKTKSAFLARNASGGAVQRLFILLDKVTQLEDPTVLPEPAALLDAAASSILDLYDSLSPP